MTFRMALGLSGYMPMAATSFALRATFLWNPDDPSWTPNQLAKSIIDIADGAKPDQANFFSD